MWDIFVVLMLIAYAVYFAFAGWICLLRKHFVWYRLISISLFLVGFLCAYYDLEMEKHPGSDGLNIFFWYLISSIISSWIVAAIPNDEGKGLEDEQEKKQ